MHPIRILSVMSKAFPPLTIRSAVRPPENLLVDAFDCAMLAFQHAGPQMDRVPGKRYYHLLVLDLDAVSRDPCHITPPQLASIIRCFHFGLPLVFVTGNPERVALTQCLDEPKRTIVCPRTKPIRLERSVTVAVDELLPLNPQPTL